MGIIDGVWSWEVLVVAWMRKIMWYYCYIFIVLLAAEGSRGGYVDKKNKCEVVVFRGAAHYAGDVIVFVREDVVRYQA